MLIAIDLSMVTYCLEISNSQQQNNLV